MSHPAFTGLSRQHLGALVTELAPRREARCESGRHDRRGWARQREAGAAPKYGLVFTDRLLVTLVHLRTWRTHEALGVIYEVGSSTGAAHVRSAGGSGKRTPECQLASEHAACERSGGGFLAGIAGDRIEGEAEFVECFGKQLVDVVVRLGACAGGEDSKAGGAESGDERITGGIDDVARTDFCRTPECGMFL
ncbi:transposase family protein [Streptomyces sp. NBC_01142]|uniref:transposase family protein n=1 Tax=Streptomyces sp. NBC_01142 TaxID=2975865 RepID=UPI00225BF03F|nr:transposase family protein [Streptomyces sp. NBC_01142]MCX4825798.1 transposase family protein [Streptomyces sp. NBC_01142]